MACRTTRSANSACQRSKCGSVPRSPTRASLRLRTPTRKPGCHRGSNGPAQDAYTTAAKGATDYNLKVIEIARTNTNAAFDYAYEFLGVKSPSEFVELSSAHAHKQFEAMTAQTKELTELAQNVTTEITAKDWRHGDSKESYKVA